MIDQSFKLKDINKRQVFSHYYKNNGNKVFSLGHVVNVTKRFMENDRKKCQFDPNKYSS